MVLNRCFIKRDICSVFPISHWAGRLPIGHRISTWVVTGSWGELDIIKTNITSIISRNGFKYNGEVTILIWHLMPCSQPGRFVVPIKCIDHLQKIKWVNSFHFIRIGPDRANPYISLFRNCCNCCFCFCNCFAFLTKLMVGWHRICFFFFFLGLVWLMGLIMNFFLRPPANIPLFWF